MKTAALVLSGGGALGVSHIGALRKLEQKYSFDFLCGVSAGGIVSAAVACGKSADEISKIIHDQNFMNLAFDFSKSSYGILKAQKVLDLLESVYEGRNFEDLPQETKLHIFATDFTTGEQVILQKGSIAKSVRASLSVPILFEPFELNNKWLVDGGLSQNFPLDYAIKNYKGESIIGVDAVTQIDGDIDFSQQKIWGRTKKMRNAMERTFRIFFKNQQQHFPEDDRVIVYKPKLSPFTSLDILKLKEIEKAGEESIS